eukprot:3940981-Rhodomonas_salina.5
MRVGAVRRTVLGSRVLCDMRYPPSASRSIQRCARFAMCGTEIAYGAPSGFSMWSGRAGSSSLSPYALATRCPAISGTDIPHRPTRARYTMSGTDIACAATRRRFASGDVRYPPTRLTCDAQACVPATEYSGTEAGYGGTRVSCDGAGAHAAPQALQ